MSFLNLIPTIAGKSPMFSLFSTDDSTNDSTKGSTENNNLTRYPEKICGYCPKRFETYHETVRFDPINTKPLLVFKLNNHDCVLNDIYMCYIIDKNRDQHFQIKKYELICYGEDGYDIIESHHTGGRYMQTVQSISIYKIPLIQGQKIYLGLLINKSTDLQLRFTFDGKLPDNIYLVGNTSCPCLKLEPGCQLVTDTWQYLSNKLIIPTNQLYQISFNELHLNAQYCVEEMRIMTSHPETLIQTWQISVDDRKLFEESTPTVVMDYIHNQLCDNNGHNRQIHLNITDSLPFKLTLYLLNEEIGEEEVTIITKIFNPLIYENGRVYRKYKLNLS